MIKNAAIIGSNGYLGRNIAFFLQTMGIELFCYDIHDQSLLIDCEYHYLDITDYKQVCKINLNVDAVFVFAGITGTEQSFIDYERYTDVNIKGLLNILTHIKESKSEARVIFPSTRLVYKGKTDTPLNEESEKEAKTIYASTKIFCENLLQTYYNIFGINYTIFRIGIPYGNLFPGDVSYGTVGFFLQKAQAGKNITLYGDGILKRTFTNISDLCKTIVFLTDNEETNNNTYNIGGVTYCLYEVALLIAQKHHVGIDFKPWPKLALKIESGDTIFDDQKIQKVMKITSYQTFENWLNE